MLRRRKFSHPYRWFFWLVAFSVSLLWFFDRHPWELSTVDAVAEARLPRHAANSDVLVLLSDASRSEAAARGEFDPSATWIDVFRQEIGPVRVADMAEVDRALLQEHRFVVVTRGASSDPRMEALAPVVEEVVQAGARVVLELPQGTLRRQYGADGQGGWRTPRVITSVAHLPPDELLLAQQVPLPTRFLGSTRPQVEAETLLAMDGAPVVYAQARGLGWIFVVDVDVSGLLYNLQHGVAEDGGRVRSREPGQPITTADMVANSALFRSSTPYADVFERLLVHAVFRHGEPLFALWPYPNGARGALLLSHEARHHGGRPLWLSVHERSLQARTPTFLPTPPEDAAPAWLARGDEVGHAALLWNPRPEAGGQFRARRFLGFAPLRRPLSLQEQRQTLESALGRGADVRGVRVVGGAWHSDRYLYHGVMEAAGLRYSATFGPTESTPQGYLFGTCQPVTPLGPTGAPWRMQEVPLCFLRAQTDEERAHLLDAVERAHDNVWAVHLLTSTDLLVSAEGWETFAAWRDATADAQRRGMWIGGPGELATFWQRRAETELRVKSWEVRTRTSEGEPRVVDVVVEASTNTRGMVLMLPASIGALRLESVSRGVAQVQAAASAARVDTQTTTFLGRDVRLLPLQTGFSTIAIRYQR